MVNLNAVEAARWRSDRRLSSRSLQAVFVIVFVASTNATRFFLVFAFVPFFLRAEVRRFALELFDLCAMLTHLGGSCLRV
jgi:hypothetical protein